MEKFDEYINGVSTNYGSLVVPVSLALKTVRGGLCDCARNEMLYRGIRCGEPLICTDPKGKLYSMTYKMAKEHNYIVREFNLNQRP